MKKTCSSFTVCLPALIISLLKGGDDLGALFATEEGMARQEGEEGDQKKDEPAKKRKRQKKKDFAVFDVGLSLLISYL